RDSLAPFIVGARRAGGRRRTGTASTPTRPTTDREQNQAIRAWAKRNGHEISERGRIPAEVLAEYHDAARKPAAASAAGSALTTAEKDTSVVSERIAAVLNPAPAKPATPRKPRAKRGDGAVVPPKAAPAATVTRMNKLTETMIGSVCEFAGEILIDHGDSWVELRGNRDDVAAKITAVQSDMPGQSMTDRAAKAALTRVVKELRNVKSRKVEERDAAA
ncbi:MAG: Lsr2 family DNA-binding protein, partial [Stackebrandtia sp.]